MANKTNSPQEAVLKELAEHSLAAPFVFMPDIPMRTKDEPADLAWVCNNCVILMYMTERGSTPTQGNALLRVRENAIGHNLGQAGRWLKTWKSGVPLTGANGYHTFHINYDSSYRVVVLSIIKCGDATAGFHDDNAKKLGVVCCATLPQSAIEWLAHTGGTSLDLLLILGHIRAQWGAGPVPETSILGLIRGYVQAMCDAIGFEKYWPGYQIDVTFREAAYPMLAARRRKAEEGPSEPTAHWVGMRNLNDVFNDINIAEFFFIAMRLRDMIGQVRTPSKGYEGIAYGTFPVNDYDFRICITSGMTSGIQEKVSAVCQEWEAEIQSGKGRHGPAIFMNASS